MLRCSCTYLESNVLCARSLYTVEPCPGMRGATLPVFRGEPRLPRWAEAWLRASPAVVSHAWRVLQPRRQRELPRRTCPRPAPCSAGWPSTGRPLTPGRAACAACGPGATRITHGPTAGTRTRAPRRPRAIRIRHGPTAARAAWRAGAAGVLDGAAAGPGATTASAARGPGAGRATAGTPRPP